MWTNIQTDSGDIHSVPDDEAHSLSTVCPCAPSIEVVNDHLCVTHNSYDGREALEWALAILAT